MKQGARTIPVNQRKVDLASARRIARLRELGMSWTEIANRWGLGVQSVKTIAKLGRSSNESAR